MTGLFCWLGFHNTPKDYRGYKHAHCFWCGKYIPSKTMKHDDKAIRKQQRLVKALLRKLGQEPITFTETDIVVNVATGDVNYIKGGPAPTELNEAIKKLYLMKEEWKDGYRAKV